MFKSTLSASVLVRHLVAMTMMNTTNLKIQESGTYQDLGRATALLRDIASRHHLDLSHAIAIGHSSGGQLVM